MGGLDDRIAEFCARAIAAGSDEDLEMLAAESAGIIGALKEEKPEEAPDLYGAVTREAIEGRIREIAGFGDSRVSGERYMGGGAGGAFELSLKGGDGPAGIILKLGDGDGDALGARLAGAAGLSCPAVHPGKGFMLMERVDDLAGRAIRKSGIGVECSFVADEVRLFEDALRREPVRSMMRSDEGREMLFSAWLDYLELCRICILGDRQHGNTAIAAGEGKVAFVPIDLDAVAYQILIRRSGEPYLGAYDSSFGFNSAFMILAMSDVSGIPAGELGEGLRRSAASRIGNRFGPMERRRDAILAVLRDPENNGIIYGISGNACGSGLELRGDLSGCRRFDGRTEFTEAESRILCGLVTRLCAEDARRSFLDAHLKALGFI